MWPERLAASAWLEHLPFAFWIIDAARPRMIVQLGTHYGTSYCAFLQAVQHLELDTSCYAVDTWKGDPQTSFYGEDVYAEFRAYHDRRHAAFSTLIRSTFDEAAKHFADSSIDLLHIDGYHTYEASKHDFETWLPKLSRRGVILFHDINVREGEFGAWRLWKELCAQYPSFDFLHGFGLGILGVGEDLPRDIRWLTEAVPTQKNLTGFVRTFFEKLGRGIRERLDLDETARELALATSNIARLSNELTVREEEIGRLHTKLSAREEELGRLAATITTHEGEIGFLSNQITALHNSTSWRITAPLRSIVLGARQGADLIRRSGLRRECAQSASSALDYAEWIRRYDTLDDDDRRAIAAAVEQTTDPPLISVLMPVYETPPGYLRAAIESVRN